MLVNQRTDALQARVRSNVVVLCISLTRFGENFGAGVDLVIEKPVTEVRRLER